MVQSPVDIVPDDIPHDELLSTVARVEATAAAQEKSIGLKKKILVIFDRIYLVIRRFSITGSCIKVA